MRRLGCLVALVGFVLLLCPAFCASPRRYQSPRFVVETSEGGPGNLDFHARLCERALTQLAPGLPESFPLAGKMRVWVSPSRGDFARRSRLSAHSILAVAFPAEGRMVLNDEALRAAGAMERVATVSHEMAHLLLGRVAGETHVPLWLHEGLAQSVSSMELEGGAMRLAWASLTGRLIPMSSLTSRFPYGHSAAPVAYAQSKDFTRFVATRELAFGNSRDFFAYVVEHPEEARVFFGRLSDPAVLGAMEIRWRAEMRGPVNWLLALTGSGVLWGLVVLLFLAAYWRKKLHERRVIEGWDPWEGDSEDEY